MTNNLELQLLLKLNDQMSKGLKSAMQSAQQESKGLAQSVVGIANAASRIKPTAIERMTSALRSMHGAAKSSVAMLQKVAQAGAAAAAGGYVLKSAADRPMAYDRRLAIMANTAYSGRDVAGRIAGKSEMDAGIRGAVKYGGSPEQAAETLNELIGSGAMGQGQSGINSSLRLLPMLQKAATETGGDSKDLAKIVIAAKQSMGITDEQIPSLLSKAIKGGQEGGFELKDMSRWLPQQMALAGGQGMKGMKGFETLISANQVSRISAGTADEAGNNLVNLLTKINSKDTSNDFKKLGIDLSGSLAAAREKGMNPLDAFVALVGKVGEKDKKYLEFRAKSEKQTGTEQSETYGAMADLMMAKGIGNTVQDRQALMALIAMIQQKDKYGQIKNTVMAEQGKELETGFGTVASTVDFKAEQVSNKKAFAAMDTLSTIEKPLGFLLDGLNKGADAFPGFTAALYAATVAVGALAAVSGVAGIFSVLKRGGGGAVGVAADAASAAGGVAVASKLKTMTTGVKLLTAAPTLASIASLGAGAAAMATALVGAAGLAGYGAGTGIYKYGIEGTDLADKIGGTIATILANFGNKEAQQALEINLSVDGRQLTTVVNSTNATQARRN